MVASHEKLIAMKLIAIEIGRHVSVPRPRPVNPSFRSLFDLLTGHL